MYGILEGDYGIEGKKKEIRCRIWMSMMQNIQGRNWKEDMEMVKRRVLFLMMDILELILINRFIPFGRSLLPSISLLLSIRILTNCLIDSIALSLSLFRVLVLFPSVFV